MSIPTQNTDQPNEAFIRRALDHADLNVARMALYLATGDESLTKIRLNKTPVRGGAAITTTIVPEDQESLKKKILEFLLTQAPRAEHSRLEDAEIRRLMELMSGEALSDKEFAYRRDMLALDEFPRAASWTHGKPALPEGFHVAIIGAGMSGIITGIQFERLGIPYTIYERRNEVGGTWSINTYPDVRVDTSIIQYQFSFEKRYPWTEFFARQPEMRRYLEHVARKYGIMAHIRFDRDMQLAEFDEQSATWAMTFKRSDGSTERGRANVVVAASGLFGVPKKLDIQGRDEFQGEILHTTQWRDDIDLSMRNVAVIGNGSTGVQLLSTIASKAKRVYVFQRTPQWITPRERYGAPIPEELRWLIQRMPYYWHWNMYSMLSIGIDPQNLQEMDPSWQNRGGLVNQRNDALRAFLTGYIESKVGHRPDLFSKLVPTYAPLARRLIVDNGWYEALLKEHVELVTDPIALLTPHAIRTVDNKERPVDLIVSATGFQTTKYVFPADYRGRGGVSLQERWEREGARAYLGITVPDFPNFFMHYGPNSQPRAASLIAFQEIWARYTAQSVVALIEGGHRFMAPRREVFERYNADMDEAARGLVWLDKNTGGRNYYVDATGRSSVNSPWRVEDYYQYFARHSLQDFELA